MKTTLNTIEDIEALKLPPDYILAPYLIVACLMLLSAMGGGLVSVLFIF